MSAFTDAIDTNMEGVNALSAGRCCSCETCNPDNVSEDEFVYDEDPSFSWTPCDCCNSHLGGDRFAAHGFIDDDLIHFRVCIDCVCYLANGDEPENWEG